MKGFVEYEATLLEKMILSCRCQMDTVDKSVTYFWKLVPQPASLMKLPVKEGPSTSRDTASALYQQKVSHVCEKIMAAWLSPPVSEWRPTSVYTCAIMYICARLIHPRFTSSGVFLCFPRGHAASPQADVLPAVWLGCGKVRSQCASNHLHQCFLTGGSRPKKWVSNQFWVGRGAFVWGRNAKN